MLEQQHEVIERCNLPMRDLFSRDEVLRDKVEELLQGESFTIWQLATLARTFRQMVLLDQGNGLSAVCCNAIMEQMELRDAEEPIYLNEVYPYMKKDFWELHMNEVSYFKVHVQNETDWSIELDRIEKGYDQKEQKQYLDLFPFDEEVDTLLDEWEECGRCYRVYFDEPTKCEKFVKDILLDGCADLSKV